jgi:hypothetical protein
MVQTKRELKAPDPEWSQRAYNRVTANMAKSLPATVQMSAAQIASRG